jgi:hypothetical protein
VDLSGSSNRILSNVMEMDWSPVKMLFLAECGIDVWKRKTMDRVRDIVSKALQLEILDLSYNPLSGEPAAKFVCELVSIGQNLREVRIWGTILANQEYPLPKIVSRKRNSKSFVPHKPILLRFCIKLWSL